MSFTNDRSNKNFKYVLICIAICASLFLIHTIFQIDPKTKNEINARRLLNLPKEATIIKVEFGDWSGDGSVNFTLPKDRLASEWLDIVWKLNPPEKNLGGKSHGGNTSQRFTTRDKEVRLSTIGGGMQSLDYEKESGLYLYYISHNR